MKTKKIYNNGNNEKLEYQNKNPSLTQNTKNKHVQKKSIFKQENYISSNSVIPEDEALSQKINLKDTIDEVPKARRNLNIKLVH